MPINASDLLSPLTAGDWSRRMIEAIFGTATAASDVSSLLTTIASALVVLGTMWLGYGIVSTIVGAARTGRPLSDSTSGVWGALRPVIGMGMLIPVAGVGLSGVQVLLREVAVVSANLGNQLATQYVENAALAGTSSLPISGAGQTLVYGVARAEVCAAVRLAAGRVLGDLTTAARIPEAAGAAIESQERRSWWTGEVTEAGRVSGYAWDYGPACGSLTISNPANFGAFGDARRQAVASVVDAVRKMRIGEGLAQAIGSLPGNITADDKTLSQSLVDFWRTQGVLVTQLVRRLNYISEEYDRKVSEYARKTATSTDTKLREKLVEHVKNCGWPCVGGYYRVLGTINLASSSAAAERPTVTAPDPAAWDLYSPAIGAALKLVDNQVFTESSDVRLTANDLRTQADDDADSTFSRIIESITQPLKDYFTRYDGISPDPISDLMNTGNNLLVASESAFAIGAAASGGAHFFGAAAGSVFDFLLRAGWPAIAAGYGAGVMLQYVNPLIPWIYVTYAYFAWGLELLVGSIAVLFWAFSHLRLDGGSFVDRAQAFGYGSLFVSVLLRPAIVVAAYDAAISVSNIGLNFLRYSFSFASDAALSGLTLGISGVLVYGILALVIQFMAFHYIFRSILTAPERVGQWLGQQISSWRESEGGAVIVGAIGGQAGRFGGGGLPGARGSGGKSKTAGGGDAGISTAAGVSRPK